MTTPFARQNERLPSVGDLCTVLRLDVDGLLWWREMPADLMPNEAVRKKWNNHHKGNRAFTAANGKGYRYGRVLGVRSAAHAVIFKMFYGYEAVEVDHRDGDKLNNRPSNLRSVNRSINSRNRAMSSRNRSGFVGVHWSRKDRRWIASIHVDGRQKTLGSFTDIKQAIEARKTAEMGLGYTERHGQSARNT